MLKRCVHKGMSFHKCRGKQRALTVSSCSFGNVTCVPPVPVWGGLAPCDIPLNSVMHERYARTEKNGELQGDKVVEHIQMERERKKYLITWLYNQWMKTCWFKSKTGTGASYCHLWWGVESRCSDFPEGKIHPWRCPGGFLLFLGASSVPSALVPRVICHCCSDSCRAAHPGGISKLLFALRCGIRDSCFQRQLSIAGTAHPDPLFWHCQSPRESLCELYS